MDFIIFSDKAHFELGGFVNKQNCRMWGEENPREILQTSMDPRKITVWYGLWSGGVIRPYFFENDIGNAITMNGCLYRNMIQTYL